uniref:HYR domain-containing protein n=1 Tax=Ditylenchus dipsaci TaxID=166011 RepID=A0A915E737_9BILA
MGKSKACFSQHVLCPMVKCLPPHLLETCACTYLPIACSTLPTSTCTSVTTTAIDWQTHYVTVVVSINGSPTDRFCAQHLRLLNMDANPFLRIEALGNYEVPYAFYVNNNVWLRYTTLKMCHWSGGNSTELWPQERALQRLEDNLFEKSSTRYSLLSCVQAELLTPANPISVAKEDYLEVVEVLVRTVDQVVYEQAVQELAPHQPSR